MANLHKPRLTATEPGPGGTAWAYGEQVLYDAHERRAGERARDAEVRALVAAARAKAAEARGPGLEAASPPGTWDELHEAWQSRRANVPPQPPMTDDMAGAYLAHLAAPAGPRADPPARCDGCGYLITAPGHLAECGPP